MKAVTVSILKKELKHYPQNELVDICLKLAKFKKDNKELLTYLLFESTDENQFIQDVKSEIDEEFRQYNYSSFYYLKKSIRKTLRQLKKYIRYSKQKQTEVEILIYFCYKLKNITPSYTRSLQLINIYDGQLAMAKKAIAKLHEDLQYDYQLEMQELDLI